MGKQGRDTKPFSGACVVVALGIAIILVFFVDETGDTTGFVVPQRRSQDFHHDLDCG